MTRILLWIVLTDLLSVLILAAEERKRGIMFNELFRCKHHVR